MSCSFHTWRVAIGCCWAIFRELELKERVAAEATEGCNEREDIIARDARRVESATRVKKDMIARQSYIATLG